MQTFLEMGGYGAYVWSSYALVAVVLTGNVAWPYLRLRRLRRELRRESVE